MAAVLKNTPPAEKPAADAQDRQLTDLVVDPEQGERLPAPGAVEASRARVCGDCGHGGKAKHGFLHCSFMPVWVRMSERSLCEFAPVRWMPVTEAIQAKRDAQAGIDSAVAAADRALAGWSDMALEFVKLFAIQHRGERFIGNEIVEASKVKGVIQPGNPRAWGGPIQRAVRAGVIKRVGFAPDPNRHENPVPLWETV